MPEALARYEARRRPRAGSFVSRSLQFGRVATLESRPLAWLRDTAMRMTPQWVVQRGVEDLYRASSV